MKNYLLIKENNHKYQNNKEKTQPKLKPRKNNELIS